MRREYRLTEVVKKYDPKLFVKRGDDQKLHLIRDRIRWNTFYYNDVCYRYSQSDPFQIMSLTDDWSANGQAVDWGIEPLMARIREIDSQRSSEIIDRINLAHELREESKARDFDRMTEDFTKELKTAADIDFKDFNASQYDYKELVKKVEKERK